MLCNPCLITRCDNTNEKQVVVHSTFPSKREVLHASNNPWVCRSLYKVSSTFNFCKSPLSPLQMCVYTGDREGKGGRKKSSPSELAGRSREDFFCIPQVLDFGHIPAMKVGLLGVLRKHRWSNMNQDRMDRGENFLSKKLDCSGPLDLPHLFFTNCTPK